MKRTLSDNPFDLFPSDYAFRQRKLLSVLRTEEEVRTIIKTEWNFLDIPSTTKCCVAGGAILSLFCNASHYVNDLDIFSYSEKDLNELLVLFGLKWKVRSVTDNSYTYETEKISQPSPQLIKIRKGMPQEVIDSFDFTICAVAYDFNLDKFFYHKNWKQDVLDRKIRLTESRNYKNMSLYRVSKYENRGFTKDFDHTKICEVCAERILCMTSGEKECLKKQVS